MSEEAMVLKAIDDQAFGALVKTEMGHLPEDAVALEMAAMIAIASAPERYQRLERVAMDRHPGLTPICATFALAVQCALSSMQPTGRVSVYVQQSYAKDARGLSGSHITVKLTREGSYIESTRSILTAAAKSALASGEHVVMLADMLDQLDDVGLRMNHRKRASFVLLEGELQNPG